MKAEADQARSTTFATSLLFALAVAGVTVTTYAVNAHYDVSALDQGALITRLAAAQTDSDLLIWQDAFDQRAWLKERLADNRSNHDVVIIGSSTLGNLSQSMFPGVSLLNGWMSAPTIEDFEAATVLLEHASHRPRTVVLGIDAWFLNPAINDQRWRSLTAEFIQYRRSRGAGVWVNYQRALGRWAVFKERLTYVTLRETIAFARKARRAAEPITPWLARQTPQQYCAVPRPAEYVRTYVGDYIACPASANPQAVVDSEAKTYVTDNTHSMAEWRSVDLARAERLRAVVARIRQSGAAVVLVAPPYHPDAYAAMRSDPLVAHNLDETDLLLTDISRTTGAVFANVRDPATLWCGTTDFMDAHHTKSTCGARVAQHIRALLQHLPPHTSPL